MRRIITIIISVILLNVQLLAFQTKIIYQKGQKIKIVSGEIVAIIDTTYSAGEVRAIFSKSGFSIVDSIPQLKAYLLKIPPEKDEKQCVEDLSWLPFVKKAEYNFVSKSLFVPNDPMYGSQWGLHKIGAQLAWNISRGSENIKLGIMDSGLPMSDGYSVDHPDMNNGLLPDKLLRGRYIPGIDFTDEGDNTIQDLGGHGTHVAGIAGALSNNYEGVTGIDHNCKVYMDQVFIPVDIGIAIGSDFWSTKAMIDIVNQGGKVINYSGGGSSYSYLEELGVKYLKDNGVLFCVGAGNSGYGGLLWPAKFASLYQNVISVGATDSTDHWAEWPEVNKASSVGARAMCFSTWR